MEKKVLGGLFQINPVTKTGQRLYMVREELYMEYGIGQQLYMVRWNMQMAKNTLLSGEEDQGRQYKKSIWF